MRSLLRILQMEGIKTAIYAVCILLVMVLSALLTIAHFPLTMDFGSFLASGQESLSKGNPYTYDNKLVFIVPINELDPLIPSPNLNPPISIPVFELLAKFGVDPKEAAMRWKAISALWYAAIVFYLIKRNPKPANYAVILWLFALAGFWQTIEVGQIYMPLVTLALFAWDRLKNNKPAAAGIFIGILIAIKPQFAIWAVFLLFAGQWKAFISSAVSFLLISLIPLYLYGTQIYIQWALAISQYNGILLPGNTSLQSFAAHMGIPDAGNILGAALLFYLLVFTAVKKIKPMRSNSIALLSTLLVSPYSWCGYTLFLLPVFFEKNEWSWKMRVAAGLLTVPFVVTLAAFATTKINFLMFGWLYGWAVVLLLLDELSRPALAAPISKGS